MHPVPKLLDFLDSQPKKVPIMKGFPNNAFEQVFVRYNTAIPSSAAVERVFPLGKDILKPKRCGLSDEHFDMLVFLKHNHNT